MALQVGNACYATEAEASAATCAALGVDVATGSTGAVQAAYCSGVVVGGGFNMRVVRYTTGGAISSTYNTTVAPLYQPCQQPDIVASSHLIIGALLALWGVTWGLWKIKSIVDAYRGEP